MDLEARKISFVQEFLSIQNEEIITYLEKILVKRKALLLKKDNSKPMSIEQFNQEIDIAIEDSKNDRVTKASELKSKIQKWS